MVEFASGLAQDRAVTRNALVLKEKAPAQGELDPKRPKTVMPLHRAFSCRGEIVGTII